MFELLKALRVHNLTCFFVTAFFLLTTSFSSAQNKADQLLGKWMDSKHEMLVDCYKEGGKYFAKVLWVENLKDKGKPLPKDEQHWINMVVMKNFEYIDNEWTNGTIYQPKTDKTYSAFIKAVDVNTIRLTGYVWLRIFSESEVFTRAKK